MTDTERNRDIRTGKRMTWEKFRDENRHKSRNVEINGKVWKEGKNNKHTKT
jgi:hypothetical protein